MSSGEPSSCAPPEGDSADENDPAAPLPGRHRRNPDVAWVEAVHGRCVLTDIADFRHFQLSGPSAEVWSRIDGCASDDAVVRAVLASYPDHPDTADAECRSFIQTMTDIGLLLLQPGSGRGEPDDDDHPAHGGRVAQPAQKGPIA